MDEKIDSKPPSEDSQELGLGEDTIVVSERALVRKLDLRLLPGVTILYLMSFLDRSNGGLLLEPSCFE